MKHLCGCVYRWLDILVFCGKHLKDIHGHASNGVAVSSDVSLKKWTHCIWCHLFIIKDPVVWKLFGSRHLSALGGPGTAGKHCLCLLWHFFYRISFLCRCLQWKPSVLYCIAYSGKKKHFNPHCCTKPQKTFEAWYTQHVKLGCMHGSCACTRWCSVTVCAAIRLSMWDMLLHCMLCSRTPLSPEFPVRS